MKPELQRHREQEWVFLLIGKKSQDTREGVRRQRSCGDLKGGERMKQVTEPVTGTKKARWGKFNEGEEPARSRDSLGTKKKCQNQQGGRKSCRTVLGTNKI